MSSRATRTRGVRGRKEEWGERREGGKKKRKQKRRGEGKKR